MRKLFDELLPDMTRDEIHTMLRYYEFMKEYELCDTIMSHLKMLDREEKLKDLGI
jgi:hypothetical protein